MNYNTALSQTHTYTHTHTNCTYFQKRRITIKAISKTQRYWKKYTLKIRTQWVEIPKHFEDWPSRRHWIYHHRNDSFEYRNDLVECCSLRFLIFSSFQHLSLKWEWDGMGARAQTKLNTIQFTRTQVHHTRKAQHIHKNRSMLCIRRIA